MTTTTAAANTTWTTDAGEGVQCPKGRAYRDHSTGEICRMSLCKGQPSNIKIFSMMDLNNEKSKINCAGNL